MSNYGTNDNYIEKCEDSLFGKMNRRVKQGVEYVKNSRAGKIIYDPRVEGEFFKEIKSNVKGVYNSAREIVHKKSSKLPEVIGTTTGITTTAATEALTSPALARANELLYTVTLKNGELWDVVNKRYLYPLENVGYQMSKVWPQLPFALWIAGSVAAGIGAGVVTYHVCKNFKRIKK
jgi:hypothetical protein